MFDEMAFEVALLCESRGAHGARKWLLSGVTPEVNPHTILCLAGVLADGATKLFLAFVDSRLDEVLTVHRQVEH